MSEFIMFLQKSQSNPRIMMAGVLIRLNTCYLQQEVKGDKAMGIKVT